MAGKSSAVFTLLTALWGVCDAARGGPAPANVADRTILAPTDLAWDLLSQASTAASAELVLATATAPSKKASVPPQLDPSQCVACHKYLDSCVFDPAFAACTSHICYYVKRGCKIEPGTGKLVPDCAFICHHGTGSHMESRRRNLLGLSDPIDDVKYDGLGTTDPASDLIDQASRSDGAGPVLAPATGPPEKASVASAPAPLAMPAPKAVKLIGEEDSDGLISSFGSLDHADP